MSGWEKLWNEDQYYDVILVPEEYKYNYYNNFGYFSENIHL